jgi:excinuclease ABC subunit C
VIGIAKKLEEIYYPHDSLPLHIHKKSPSLRLIQQVRDEAHRFAITFHRLKRSKHTIFTELEDIEGIGSKTTDQLLSHFKSVSKIRKATAEELQALIGPAKTVLIQEWQKKKER